MLPAFERDVIVRAPKPDSELGAHAGGPVGQAHEGGPVGRAGQRIRKQLGELLRTVIKVERRLFGRAGPARVVRNTIVGFVTQAGTRMAAALSYYALLAAGPLLVLTIALGGMLLGEEQTREIVAVTLPRVLPPSASIATLLAEQVVQQSHPATGLAAAAGLLSLIGFTRALATSLNVTMNEIGGETIQRTARLAPVMYLAVLGLLWGSWIFELLARMVDSSILESVIPRPGLLLGNVAPLLLALSHITIILAIVPRARLTWLEILFPAAVGAVLWESARNLFGWLVGTDSYYLRLFGPLGGVLALLGWIYLSSAILVLTGQLTWAFAMERRGRGDLARHAPRQAGLDHLVEPFEQDNAVNEAHRV